MDGKSKAIIAHITLIGWIIALVMNNSEKDELASFYIRQTLGLIVISFAAGIFSIIPLVGLLSFVVYLALFVLWVISIINAASAKTTPLPVVGELFQDWFKGI